MSKGTLRIYLGAAPGVGKTYAMLNEGYRKALRGADVVIGVAETHGREHTASQLRTLEPIPLRDIEYRGAVLREMDLDAIVARRPDLVLVDEFAHTNAPGSRNEKRWQDVRALLDAGISVISTLNIQHLESLNDVVTRITGITQRETVPDAVVRAADQIELIDMSPEALRRRMAHGNIYPAERIDAALGNYFRSGNLGALRELALLWVAGRVEESLTTYLVDHGITEAWETRERVVVAITGAPSGDRLIRRAARMAGRVGGDLLAVHIAVGDGLADDTASGLDAQRRLVRELGGTVHEVVGHSRADALVAFATGERATQLVVGATKRTRWYELWHGSLIAQVSRLASGIDLHVIGTDDAEATIVATRGARPTIERRRTLAAWALTAAGIPALTAAMVTVRGDVELSTELLIFLSLVVVVSALGGRLVAAVAAVASSLAVNWFLVVPYYELTISDPEHALALGVFIAVAVTVGTLVHTVEQRSAEARLARAEAEALARSAAELAADPNPLPGLMTHLRTTFGLEGTRIRAGTGVVVAASGNADGEPDLVLALRVGDEAAAHQLELFGPRTTADEQRVLRVLADQLAVALETEQLAKDAARAAVLAETDAVRTALLRAVSHDLRTPLASIKAMVSGLRDRSVDWSAEQLAEGLATIDSETDRLTRLVGNLLDASRLQTGAVAVELRATDVAEVVRAAIYSIGAAPETFDVDVADDLPFVTADSALLERALANLLTNAQRFSPPHRPVRIDAQTVGPTVVMRVVDRGPGIAADHHAHVIAPFQRLGDAHHGEGVGLGLSIAQGFVDAIGATMTLDETSGGGLTVTLVLPTDEPTGEPGVSDTRATSESERSP